MTKASKLNFIDVFSGAGGLSCGMELAGLNCVLGIEIDKYAAETFKANHKNAEVFCGDIRKLDQKTLSQLTKNLKIDAVFGARSIDDRIVLSPIIIGTTNVVLELIGKEAVKAYFND
jgi:predicted RNA methylase